MTENKHCKCGNHIDERFDPCCSAKCWSEQFELPKNVNYCYQTKYCYVEFAEGKAEELIQRFRVQKTHVRQSDNLGVRAELFMPITRLGATCMAITAAHIVHDNIPNNKENAPRRLYWKEVINVLEKIKKSEVYE